MGRARYLLNPQHIDIVLEERQIKELDRIAGRQSRSAAIRWLIKNAISEEVERALKLEQENRKLKELVEVQGKRIEELERKMKAQTGKNKGKMADSKREQIEKYYQSYERWRNGLEKNNSEYTFERGILWIESRARRVHTAPEQLLNEFEERFNTEQSGEQWDHT